MLTYVIFLKSIVIKHGIVKFMLFFDATTRAMVFWKGRF